MWRSGATLRCGAWASHCGGFSCCGARALGTRASVVVVCGLSSCGLRALEHRLSSLWRMGLVAPWHVESSWTRDRTHVPCIGRQILNHCATREVQYEDYLIVLACLLRHCSSSERGDAALLLPDGHGSPGSSLNLCSHPRRRVSS